MNRHLTRAGYLVGLALILIPMFDAGTSVLPLRLGDTRWRYGVVGLLSNSLLIPMAGVLVVFAIANAMNHRRTLRALGVISLVSSVACLAAMAAFALDALQARSGIKPELANAYMIASGTAGVKILIGAIAFGLFGAAGLTTLPKPAVSGRKSSSVLIPNHPEKSGKPIGAGTT